jgi:transcriptional regulator with XRE-family HTH domain
MKAKQEETIICERFALSFQELKKIQKISKSTIANELGTYSHIVGKYMRTNLPSMLFLYKYCKTYNVDPAFIFGFTDKVFLETKEDITIIKTSKTVRQ